MWSYFEVETTGFDASSWMSYEINRGIRDKITGFGLEMGPKLWTKSLNWDGKVRGSETGSRSKKPRVSLRPYIWDTCWTSKRRDYLDIIGVQVNILSWTYIFGIFWPIVRDRLWKNHLRSEHRQETGRVLRSKLWSPMFWSQGDTTRQQSRLRKNSQWGHVRTSYVDGLEAKEGI